MAEIYSQQQNELGFRSEVIRFRETVIGLLDFNPRSDNILTTEFTDLNENWYFVASKNPTDSSGDYISVKMVPGDKNSPQIHMIGSYNSVDDVYRLGIYRQFEGQEIEYLDGKENMDEILAESHKLINQLISVIPKYPHIKPW